MFKLRYLALITLVASTYSSAQTLATFDNLTASMQDVNAHHFLLSPQKLKAIVGSEQELLKTIDETLTMRRFAKNPTQFVTLAEHEKKYYDVQTERASLTAALAIVERRAREKFNAADPVVVGRAREIWKLDESKYIEDASADITVIHFDSRKRDWNETVARIAAAQNEIAAGVKFDAVVEKYSDEATVSKTQGALKGVRMAGVDPTFASAVFTQLKVGEVSAPIPARRGIYIIRLDARTERMKKRFEDVQGAILAEMLERDARDARGALLESVRPKNIALNDAEFAKLFPTPIADPQKIMREAHQRESTLLNDKTESKR